VREINDIDLKSVIENLTAEKFNKENKIHSPFKAEKTPSFCIYFDSNSNKQKFKDFSTDIQGDVVDFVMRYKNLNFKEAKKFLGLHEKPTDKEIFEEKIKDYIKYQMRSNKKGYKFLGLFIFVDKNNKPIYAKAKFLKPDNSKETPYYHINDEKVVNKRGYDEVPYNYFNLLKAIEEGKIIVFVEGEKDANSINHMFQNKDYVASSLKCFKDFEKIKSENMKIYVIGDTGEAGDHYVSKIKEEFISYSAKFKIINLPGIKKLGENKDVTDWMESGHTKQDLLKAFERSLDLKDKYEYAQDNRGIYKIKILKDEEESKESKIYISDFNLLEAKKIVKIDEESEGIKLKFKSSVEGKIIEKIGCSNIFDDLKTFRNFLGIDLTFLGKMEDLIKLKMWINKYFALENEEIHLGAKFILKNKKLGFISCKGTIYNDKIDYETVSSENKIDIISKEKINKEELIELKKRIFKFLSPEKSLSIIGTVINDLAVYQNSSLDKKMHHLLIVGESESGKSTILEQIIAPILNYPLEDKQSISTTPFAMIKILSTGNYPIIFDEFKPSMMDRYKLQRLSDILRNAYDKTVISRGEKNFKTRTFRLERPLIMAGEENYPNQEKALITRSCIVYISKNERTEESSEAAFWLMSHKNILNKFGRSLIDEIVNMSIEEYEFIREGLREKFKVLKDRTMTTALNIGCGIEIFNTLMERYGISKVENYEKHIIQNIQEEVLEGSEDAKTTVEQMLILYNDMIANNRVSGPMIEIKDDNVFIRSSKMIDEIFKFIKDYGSADVVPLKLKDFRKQAVKSGYIKKINARQIRFLTGFNTFSNPVWVDLFDTEKLKKLNVYNLSKEEMQEEEVSEYEEKMFAN